MTKILIIEDEIELRESVVDWLLFEDFIVLQAGDGRIGVDLAMQELPDIIISDVMMPGMDGYEVLNELHAHRETATIPFIFLTALADRREIRHGMEMGADDYLTKPFTRVELLNAIQSRLERHSANQQQTEEALAELRQTILRTLPHELRTPLTGILGLGEILAYTSEDLSVEELQEIGELTLESGNRLLRLIENYQYFVEIELRGADFLKGEQQVKAGHPLHEISRKLSFQYERAADLRVTAEDATLGMDEADWNKVVFELVDNAFKFSSPRTTVRVNGLILDEDPLKQRYQLRVQDYGWGFEPEHLTQIGGYVQFDRPKREQQGSGLGLAIVKRLARVYDAAFHIESTAESGTTITFTLPLDREPTDPDSATEF
ncbi:MAG: hybrid sensor histidine kinase/response regulator [Anaerolineales bacterium]|nr:hybrid sensor histidine kinase/response regulator [Anaerolineales bacterium]